MLFVFVVVICRTTVSGHAHPCLPCCPRGSISTLARLFALVTFRQHPLQPFTITNANNTFTRKQRRGKVCHALQEKPWTRLPRCRFLSIALYLLHCF